MIIKKSKATPHFWKKWLIFSLGGRTVIQNFWEMLYPDNEYRYRTVRILN
jgi:hypothetical protein